MYTPKTEVVIIGAGIMGLSTAYYLTKKGIKVSIVEQLPYLGGFSTSKCAGGFRSQFNTKLNVELSLRNQILLKELVNEHHLKLRVNRCGYYFLAKHQQEADMLQEAVKLQNSMGINTYTVYGNILEEKLPYINCEDILMASVNETEGLMEVNDLTSFLINYLKKEKVSMYLNTKVLDVEFVGGKVDCVRTSKGIIKTSSLVIAAGAWSREIANVLGIELPITCKAQQLFLTTPVEWAYKLPIVVFLHNGLGFHTQSQRIVSGMTKDVEQKCAGGVDNDWLFTHCVEAVRYMPSIAELQIASEWWGYYESTPDDKPIISRLSKPAIYCMAGFDGHGLMHGLVAGEIMSSIIMRETYYEINTDEIAYKRFKSKGVQEYKSEIRI